MLILKLILGPIVGGVIGGITNKIAIKMLFEPYEAKYIGKMHIPFTPGIIPKEKSRIAKAISNAVSENLLDSETLSNALLSDEMLAKVENGIDGVIAKVYNSPKSIREFACTYAEESTFDATVEKIEASICKTINAKLDNPEIGEKIATLAIDQALEKMSSDGILGKIGAFGLSVMRDKAQNALSRNINEMLRNNAPEMVEKMIKNESAQLLNKPVSSMLNGHDDMLSEIKTIVLNAYKSVIATNMTKILNTLDIQKIIEDKLNAMDMKETEELIISIMDKELKALVWFGVVLGFIMGGITDLMYLF